jgi:hypothetical protein
MTDGTLHARTRESRDSQDKARRGGLQSVAMAGAASARRTRGPFWLARTVSGGNI